MKTLAALVTGFAALLTCAACDRKGDETKRAKAQPSDARPAEAARPGVASLYLPTGDKDSSPLRLDKEVPPRIRKGAPFTTTLTVTNVSAQSLQHLVVRERLPKDFRAAPDATAELRDGAAVWSIPTLAPGESKKLALSGSLPEAGSFRSCTSVTYEPELCTVLEVMVPALTLETQAPRQILVCDPLVMKVRVANAGSERLEGVRVEGQLPEGWTPEKEGAAPAVDVGALDVGQSRDVELRLKASRKGTFTHRAVARSGDVTAEATTETAVLEPALEVEKTSTAEANVGGKPAELRITVRNSGDGPARDTTIEERFSGAVQVVGVDAEGKWADGAVRWNLGTLEPKQSRTLLVTYTSGEARRVECATRATAFCARDATAAAVTEFKGVPGVLLEVVDSNDPVRVGTHVIYTITVLNQGSTPQTRVRVKARLDRGMELLSGDGPTAVAGRVGSVEAAELERLEPGARAVWTLTVRSAQAGPARLQVTLNTNELPSAVSETEPTRFFE
jgi:uncharacterized repeat protein (TIGR01451 family)